MRVTYIKTQKSEKPNSILRKKIAFFSATIVDKWVKKLTIRQKEAVSLWMFGLEYM